MRRSARIAALRSKTTSSISIQHSTNMDHDTPAERDIFALPNNTLIDELGNTVSVKSNRYVVYDVHGRQTAITPTGGKVITCGTTTNTTQSTSTITSPFTSSRRNLPAPPEPPLDSESEEEGEEQEEKEQAETRRNNKKPTVERDQDTDPDALDEIGRAHV